MMKAFPSNLEDHLGYWLRKLSNHVSTSFAERLKKFDASVPQWVILRLLFDQESLSLKELASQINVDQGSLSRMVDRLTQRGLVSSSPSTNDRREIEICLTKKGKKLVPQLAHEADQNDHFFFSTLSKKQSKELLSLIKTLLELQHPDSKTPLT